MCHRIGRPPISTIGLGLSSVSSARRVPNPPASIAIFRLSGARTGPSQFLRSFLAPAGVLSPQQENRPKRNEQFTAQIQWNGLQFSYDCPAGIACYSAYLCIWSRARILKRSLSSVCVPRAGADSITPSRREALFAPSFDERRKSRKIFPASKLGL